ncbi:MAG: biotin transporter BioY [candidate division Zixibacteria bacterium]|nr:biotin transporter BioY [candidate division Zixibacteria bacterium]
MAGTTALHPTLMSVLWPARREYGVLRFVILILAGSLLLTLSARIQIPFWPVPMTMQTFVVLVLGIAFGPRIGAAAVLLYLFEGAMGLPVFAGAPAKGVGLAYLAGPTGGYLVGFLAGVVVVGRLAERGWDRRLRNALAALIIGDALIFAFGLAWLASLANFEAAWATGALPFLPAEALKIALAAALLPLCWRVARARRT